MVARAPKVALSCGIACATARGRRANHRWPAGGATWWLVIQAVAGGRYLGTRVVHLPAI